MRLHPQTSEQGVRGGGPEHGSAGGVQQTLPYPAQQLRSQQPASVASSPAKPAVTQPAITPASPARPPGISQHTSTTSSPLPQRSPQAARSLHDQISWSNGGGGAAAAAAERAYDAEAEQQLQQRIVELQAANQQLQDQVALMSGETGVRLQEAEGKTTALQAELEQVRWGYRRWCCRQKWSRCAGGATIRTDALCVWMCVLNCVLRGREGGFQTNPLFGSGSLGCCAFGCP